MNSCGSESGGHGVEFCLRPAMLALIALLAPLWGCNSQPAAPLLSDSPVYQNSAEGFRFLVPEGWTQTASSALPTGDIQGEVFLVRYRLKTEEEGANLQVMCMADGAYMNLEQYHSGSSFRVNLWDIVDPLTSITIHDVPADRALYKAVIDRREMYKHVTCFRRNERVYSIVGLYFEGDDDARGQIERAVDSVIWDD